MRQELEGDQIRRSLTNLSSMHSQTLARRPNSTHESIAKLMLSAQLKSMLNPAWYPFQVKPSQTNVSATGE